MLVMMGGRFDESNNGERKNIMSRIMTPFGRPIVRAVVTVDHNGQIQVSAVRLGVAVKDIPLSVIEACSLLSNALAGTLQGILAGTHTKQPGKEAQDNGATDKQ